jgi:phage shock protein E
MFSILKKLFGAAPSTDFRQLVTDGALIVDVRTPAEFQSGHIKKSVNIPLGEIKSKVNDLKKKNIPIITCCRSGNRSGMAKSILEASGIECYNGGAWNSLNSKI